MAGFLKKIGGFFVYTEPKSEEFGFELLEGENEGMENPPDENAPGFGPAADGNAAGEAGGRKDGRKKGRGAEAEAGGEKRRPPKDPEFISARLCDNIETIRQKFHMPRNRDICLREFKIGWKVGACLCYIEGMIDQEALNLGVFPRLMSREIAGELGKKCPLDVLIESVLTLYKVTRQQRFTDIVLKVLGGSAVLFVDGCDECAVLDTIGYQTRSIDQPVTEKVVRGSQEGFTESLRTNLSQLRRIIKNENLIVETVTVGKSDNNTAALVYHDGYANPEVVQEVKKRIARIDTDFVPSDGVLEQYIEDNPYSLFPQMLSTERPDRAASFIMEGQVVIITNGTPFALAVPVTFFRLLHSSEDANSRWLYGTFLRLIRIIGVFCATFLPGLYTAIVLFHPEAIPTELLISITQAKEPVPFPTLVELLILELAFELIREGGVRVPSAIGQTLGIVGAIILGQAAVAAGLVSPVVVIIVSITALGSFTIPNYEFGLAVRIERFLFIFIGTILGMYGISLMIFILALHACSIKSFGVPFFVPVAPKTKANPDDIIRYPVWMQKNRPDSKQCADRRRQGENVRDWSSQDWSSEDQSAETP